MAAPADGARSPVRGTPGSSPARRSQPDCRSLRSGPHARVPLAIAGDGTCLRAPTGISLSTSRTPLSAVGEVLSAVETLGAGAPVAHQSASVPRMQRLPCRPREAGPRRVCPAIGFCGSPGLSNNDLQPVARFHKHALIASDGLGDAAVKDGAGCGAGESQGWTPRRREPCSCLTRHFCNRGLEQPTAATGQLRPLLHFITLDRAERGSYNGTDATVRSEIAGRPFT